jgi:hypothetical protein
MARRLENQLTTQAKRALPQPRADPITPLRGVRAGVRYRRGWSQGEARVGGVELGRRGERGSWGGAVQFGAEGECEVQRWVGDDEGRRMPG